MNDVAKLYQVALNRELQVVNQVPLDTKRINLKLLAFLDDVYRLGEIAHVYTFWDQEHTVNVKELLDTYVDGLNLLFSIGYEIRIDHVKSHEELPQSTSAENLMFKLTESAIKLKAQYSPLIYQDMLDDYFHFGFVLGITYEQMVNAF